MRAGAGRGLVAGRYRQAPRRTRSVKGPGPFGVAPRRRRRRCAARPMRRGIALRGAPGRSPGRLRNAGDSESYGTPLVPSRNSAPRPAPRPGDRRTSDRSSQPLLERRARLPAERRQLRDPSISLRGVPSGLVVSKHELALEADDLARPARASSRIVRSSPVPTLTWLVAGVVLHQEARSASAQIVDVQELAPRRAGAPDLDSSAPGQLRLVRPCAISAGSTWLRSAGRNCRRGRRGWSAWPR